MKLWGRHMAFFARTGKLNELGDRIRGAHLVTPDARCGELVLLCYLGAKRGDITLVLPAEHIIELEEEMPGFRYIADDLAGAVRDRQRRLVTARLDAGGVLTDAFSDNVRRVVAHGMSEEGVLTVTFAMHEGDDEEGETAKYIEGAERHAGYMAPEMDRRIEEETMLRVLDRVEALRYYIDKRLGMSSIWEPTLLQFYPLEEPWSFEIVLCGPVRRFSPKDTRTVQLAGSHFRALPLSAAFFQHDEAHIHRDVYIAGQGLAEISCPPELYPSILATLFHLSKEEVTSWIETTPPSLSAVRSSAPSLSPTSRSASRRRVFSRK